MQDKNKDEHLIQKSKEPVKFGLTPEGNVGLMIPMKVDGELIGEQTVIIPAKTIELLYIESQKILAGLAKVVH